MARDRKSADRQSEKSENGIRENPRTVAADPKKESEKEKEDGGGKDKQKGLLPPLAGVGAEKTCARACVCVWWCQCGGSSESGPPAVSSCVEVWVNHGLPWWCPGARERSSCCSPSSSLHDRRRKGREDAWQDSRRKGRKAVELKSRSDRKTVFTQHLTRKKRDPGGAAGIGKE